MHERNDKWNSAYIGFRRWAEQGMWDALVQALVDLGLTNGSNLRGGQPACRF
jgi:hypothetical protein